MESSVFDDPLLWDEDRLVFEVCSKPDSAFSRVPNRSRLEQTLRDNNINGECLGELDLDTLKNELGITSYGQRMALIKAIKRLLNIPDPLSTEEKTIDLAAIQPDAYYGSQSIAIQDIFYGSEVIDNGCHIRIPGLRKAIAGLMQHYLRQPTIPLPNTPFRYRIPYNARQCVGPNSRHLFSLFLKGGVHRVEPFDEWSAQLLKQSPHTTSANVPENKPVKKATTDWMILSPGDFDTLLQSKTRPGEDNQGLGDFQYLLDKYQPDPDDNEVLPFYGDSGDENNFDDETWDEIEAERAEQALAANVMPKQDVSSIIDDSIRDLEQFWRENKLPRVQVKAYSIWLKAATLRIRKPQKEVNTRLLRRFEARLASLKDAVLAEPWQKESDIRVQCRSMEETVFSILECRHILQVLDRDTAPEKPNRKLIKPKPKVAVQLPEGEEILDSDDDIDDFLADESSSAEDIPFSEEADFHPELPSPTRETREPQASIANPTPAENFESAGHEQTVEVPGDDADIESEDDDRILSPLDKKRRATKPLSPLRLKKRKSAGSELTHLAESDSDSNLVLDAGSKPSRPESSSAKPAPQTLTIDLTMSDGPEPATEVSSSDFDVRTPPLNPVAMSHQNPAEPLAKSERKEVNQKPSADSSRVAAEPKTPVSKSRVSTPRLPPLEDVAGMKKLPWEKIPSSDRLRMLYKAVYMLKKHEFGRLCACMQSVSPDNPEREEMLKGGLVLMKDLQTRGKDNAVPKGSYVPVTKLFVTYVCAKSPGTKGSFSSLDLDKSFEAVVEASKKFCIYLIQAVKIYMAFLDNVKDKAEDVSSEELIDEDDSSDISSPDEESQLSQSVKKRKRAVAESQEAKAHQKTDRQRVLEQELRRKAMEEKFSAISSDDKAHHIINTVEPFVSLDPHIAARAKPHQIAGIRFLWREVIEDPKHQGCLLAHTMGLGKTMQVISLLVTIAQCSQSRNPKIRRQIPKHLRRSQTLILCPPTLLDNWYDELVMWLPSHQSDLLGALHKIRSAEDSSIGEWASGGGVMILSYDLFRSMLKPTENQKNAMGAAVLARREEYLLNKATLVVADEAHKMKNASSSISQLARRIKTRSRIALTGSPLNNHLEEYHTMINWIFPGYLGEMVQFRAKYVEPIQNGLYAESTAYERRVCLKKLHVLKQDLAPKVNRADISAVSKDLPSKTEYVITLPLTDLQRKAYDIYAQHMLQTYSPTGKVFKEGLFSLIAILTSLCNHPWIFMKKFKERLDRRSGADQTQEPGKETKPGGNDDSDIANASEPGPLPDIDAASPTDADRSAMEEAVAVFQEVEALERLQDPELSYRSLIVQQIIEKSILRGEKVLVFSHSLDTLDYLELLLQKIKCSYLRIDGRTAMKNRQTITKTFNSSGDRHSVCLMSTRAGGLGLNLQGASRVIIYDFAFNPMWEEQAVGRAYRLGQKQPVHVYRFKIGGTVEEVVINKAIFKTQLFSRVVDKKNPTRQASNKASDYLFLARDVDQREFEDCKGRDPGVLDSIIEESDKIRNIELTETFHKEDDEKLNDQELKEAEEEYERQRLQRDDPEAYQKNASSSHGTYSSHGTCSSHGAYSSYTYSSYGAAGQNGSTGSAVRYQPAVGQAAAVLGALPKTQTSVPAKTQTSVPAKTQTSVPAKTQTPGLTLTQTPALTKTPAQGTSTKTQTPAPGALAQALASVAQSQAQDSQPVPGLRHSSLERANRMVSVVVPGKSPTRRLVTAPGSGSTADSRANGSAEKQNNPANGSAGEQNTTANANTGAVDKTSAIVTTDGTVSNRASPNAKDTTNTIETPGCPAQ
ncbi:hypothetical protein DV738_g3776, partial [Chaetothyriales sp. CBS 135597]